MGSAFHRVKHDFTRSRAEALARARSRPIMKPRRPRSIGWPATALVLLIGACEEDTRARTTGDPPVLTDGVYTGPPSETGSGGDSGSDVGSESSGGSGACCGDGNGVDGSYCVAEVAVGVSERPEDDFFCRSECIGEEIPSLWCFDDRSCCTGLACADDGFCRPSP